MDFIGFVDGSYKEINDISSAGIGGFLIDREKKVRYLFSGPTNNTSVFDTELEALYHLLHVFQSSSLGSHKIAVFMDSLSLVQHFKKYRLGCSGSTTSWAYNVIVNHINRLHNSSADQLAKAGRSRRNLIQSWFSNKGE